MHSNTKDITGRTPDEWKGATPDSRVPPHVKLRIFNCTGGICHISGRKITPADKWDLDHVIALCNGGENKESNLAPAIRERHREKTANDVGEKSDVDSKRRRHLGIKENKRRWASRPFRRMG